MSVPAVIEEILSKHDIEFAVVEAHPSANLIGEARTTLLQDGKGKLQAIYSTGSILDVDALCRLTERELKACNPEDVEAICSKAKLERLPTVPMALGYDIIIDQELLNGSELKLDTGSEQSLVSISTEHFKQLTNGARAGAITVNEELLHQASLDDIDDIDEITSAVANFTQLRMKQRLEETLEFPPLPETAQRIIKLRVDPNADIKDLTDIVETDPALAAQVVSWAASPYYAAPGKIKSVHDAIVRVLGFDLVLNLSLGLALGKTLSLPKDNAKGFTPYWEQAVYAATAVEALVGAIPPKERPTMGMAYLSGLLHNFGYLILAEVFPPHFSNICRYQEANPFSNHCHIERHLLGVTREQLGAWLMRMWSMPEEVNTAIRFQNEADFEGEDSAYANLMFIAMRLLRKHGIGDAPSTPIPDTLFERLHLDREKAEEAIATMMESSAELNTMAANMAA
ncbi:aminoacyl-tRNA deacylase and HDOD domain-containing protein [Oceanicoccus sagamiensis]|uniref:Histidine kinase n=1 Tax=Oceanicoccus sagamiensis TaxID=716816 RepID=A0A1X9NRD3_9GAMM|nr:HDOD domain-containing protein [Oceanicoccus sagamiensis]ARN76343.1 histidine kinase [Oceanicoccus sagamiensis]